MKTPRRQDLRTTVDRESWKSFQHMIAKIATSGRGEYLMEDFLRFGRAFTKKPLMTFETTALDTGEGSGSEIRAWGYPVAPWKTERIGVLTSTNPERYLSFYIPPPLDPLAANTQALGQSFTTGVGGTFNAVRFYMRKVNSPTDYIYAKIASSLGGTPLATSNSIDGSTLQPYLTSPYYKWETFTFPSTVLAPGKYYVWLERTGPEGSPNTNYYNIKENWYDPYAGGEVIRYDGGWEAYGDSTHDLTFEVGMVPGDAVPAPFGTFHSKTPDGSFEHQANDLEIPYWTDATSWNNNYFGPPVDLLYTRDYAYMWMQSRPPTSECQEKLRYGWSLVSGADGSFETHLALTGGGPNGDEIPQSQYSLAPNWRRWSDGSVGPSSGIWGAYSNSLGASGRVQLSSANPRTNYGTYHARFGTGAPTANGGPLYLERFPFCDAPSGTWKWGSARVEPDDVVEVGLHVMGSASGATIDVGFQWINSSLNSVSLDEVNLPVTTAYVYKTAEKVVPAGAKYVLIYFNVNNTTQIVDLDGVGLQVEAGAYRDGVEFDWVPPSGQGWWITSEEHNTGYQSQFSAKCVIGCTEPRITGDNILRDPGAEFHIANTSPPPGFLSPSGQIPGFWTYKNPGCVPAIAWNSTTYGTPGACAYSEDLGWAHASAGSQWPSAWQVVTTDPRSGNYHFRCKSRDDVGSGNHYLYVVGGSPCTTPWPGWWSGNYAPWYSARVESGDYVRFGGWFKQVGNGAATLELEFLVYDSAGGYIDSAETVTPVNLTGSYAWYEFDFTMPVGSYYLQATATVHYDSGDTVEVYTDDLVLEVSGSPSEEASSGESSTPWLSPSWETMWGIDDTYYDDIPGGPTFTDTVDMGEWSWASYDLPATQLDPKYIDVPGIPNAYWTLTDPPFSAQWIRVHMKADGPCTLQCLFVAWDFNNGTPENGYVATREEMQEFEYAGTGWQMHEFHFPDTLWRTTTPEGIWGDENRYATIFFRVVGAPGTTVYLDDILQSADFTMDTCLAEITVGVAEWERDPKGMYTGARLWFKTGGPCGGTPGAGRGTPGPAPVVVT